MAASNQNLVLPPLERITLSTLSGLLSTNFKVRQVEILFQILSILCLKSAIFLGSFHKVFVSCKVIYALFNLNLVIVGANLMFLCYFLKNMTFDV